MQKAVGFLLLLAATLSVTIASPRRARMAEVEESAVAVQQVVEEVQPAGSDVAADAVQLEVKQEDEVDTGDQNDQLARTSDVVPEADLEVETGANPEETKTATALDAVEPNHAEEKGDADTDTVAISEKEQEPAAEAAAKPDETNVLTKVSDEVTQKPKRHIGDIIPQIEAFFDLLSTKVAELVGKWQNDDEFSPIVFPACVYPECVFLSEILDVLLPVNASSLCCATDDPLLLSNASESMVCHSNTLITCTRVSEVGLRHRHAGSRLPMQTTASNTNASVGLCLVPSGAVVCP
uniref:Uncharacterized protein n=1 Tax=Anopheles atroparvus TaxID=41427 RepID=A0A182JCQ0_ANOAO